MPAPASAPPVRKKAKWSTILFGAAAFLLVAAGWEFATGLSFPGKHRFRRVTEDHSYTMLFAAVAVLSAACVTKGVESR
jgi:hypothetical protein